MAIDVGEGLRRIALAIRVLFYLVAVIVAAAALLETAPAGEAIVVLIVAAVIASVGYGLSWVILGFVKNR